MSITMNACGAATTIQDLGRFGHLSSGVGISGAFDQHALALANRLVGNHVTDAGLEALGGGVRITVNRATVAAVTGARGLITVNEHVAARNVPVVMRSGDVLTIAHPTAGLRSYVPGPHATYFNHDALTVLTSNEYEVSSHSDRIGVRFIGPALERVPGLELPSAPMMRGAIQVPPDGAPVMLGPDHPVTGGYPVVAVTVRSSVDAAAQFTPGQIVRFTLA